MKLFNSAMKHFYCMNDMIGSLQALRNDIFMKEILSYYHIIFFFFVRPENVNFIEEIKP